MVEESNGSDEMENSDETKMSEEILALVDEFQQAWPLEKALEELEDEGTSGLAGHTSTEERPQDGVARSSCYGDCRNEDMMGDRMGKSLPTQSAICSPGP